MRAEHWERLKGLFAEAQLLGGEERHRFVQDACAGDPSLRAELTSLLEADSDSGSFLETPAASQLVHDLEASAPSAVGRRYGPYRVLSEIGRGGMGVVYRALRDDDAFRKEVALKLLPSELESEYFEERFRRERQILASLEHPNIARLLDGGSDQAGRPYLVMELVDGLPIDVYCRERRLDLVSRIELVRTACSAIASAHSRLVVHCDLKPANILVTPDGMPKLLDFGIARLLAPETADRLPARTVTGWWMTPEYASPEQLRGEPVTTATDVYALGLVLYELLTGRKPYDLGARSPEEIVRAVCEQPATRPSQQVLRLQRGVAEGEVGGERSTTDSLPDSSLRRLRRRLEGDLDTILLRALAKDPRRRYPTVVQLSEDLRRHLAGLPILARPDRLGYRAGKFIARHRGAVAGALLVLLSLVGGLAATARQASIARRQRAVAERRFDEVRRLARTFIFEIHDAVVALPGSTPVRKRIVELGLEYLERLGSEAAGDASLQGEIAAAYERIAAVQGGVGEANLGDTEGAIVSQRQALALREAVARRMPSDLTAQLALARAHSKLGDLLFVTGDSDGRRREYDTALAIRRRSAERVPGDPSVRRALASSVWDGAQLHVDKGEIAAGLAGFEETLALYRALGERPEATAEDRRNLALAYKKLGAVRSVAGDLAGALTSLESALAIDEARLSQSPTDPETMLDVSFDEGDLGYVLLQLGRPREAAKRYERAVMLRRTVAEADPEDVRARGVLRNGRLRLARALAAASDLAGEESCSSVRQDVERALALWAELESEAPLEEEAATERERLRAVAASCVEPARR